MKSVRSSLFVLILLCAQSVNAQNICPICEQLRNNVVRITTVFEDGSDENGFGTVIAERNNKLYVVTAKHVVYALEDGILPDIHNKTKTVSIKFFSDLGRTYPATLLSLPNTRLDINLLEVEKPEHYTWTKNYYAKNIEQGTKVWFIGRSNDWYIPTVPGSVNSISIEDELLIDINSIQPGTSGAPLISAEGVIGLIFEVDGVTAKAYPVKKLIALITAWNYPWQMKPYQENDGWPDSNEIYAGYGRESILNILSFADKNTSSGTIFLGYRYHLNKKLGIGATVVFEKTIEIYSSSSYSSKTETTALSFLSDVRFYYIHRERFQLYSGVNAGLVSITEKNTSSSESSGYFAFHINPIGFRTGKKFGFFAELGLGFRGTLIGGVSMRF
jgi:hypothetical protein